MERAVAAQNYINRMASALRVLAAARREQLQRLLAAAEGERIAAQVRARFDAAACGSEEELLDTIDALLAEMQAAAGTRQRIYAYAISLCMDQRITYDEGERVWKNGRLSLYSLLPIQSDKMGLVITSLNTNRGETGVCLAPKFPVSTAHRPGEEEGEGESLAARGMLYGINERLRCVSYYPWTEGTPNVRHIILPERLLREEGALPPKRTRIVFSPLTDRQGLLKTEDALQEIEGESYCVRSVAALTDDAHIERRFAESWLAACEHSPDIFFAPEMLATERMARVENGMSCFLRPLLKRAALSRRRPPRLTLLPTRWENGANALLAFDETGRHLGTQFKRVPYVNRREGYMEALAAPESTDVLLIHLKGYQRVAVVICAEFLQETAEYVSAFLCAQLGATLIVVPSYSPGEQDFMRALSALRRYGASVVWGNCCAAATDAERIIGGCSYAGADELRRFGDACECGFRCDGCEVCFFMLDLPARLLLEKPSSPDAPSIFHVCRAAATECAGKPV